MHIKDYYAEHRGAAQQIAAALGISTSYMSQMAGGFRPWRPVFCPLIEELTNGAVTRADLRPDDWREIWPEYTPPETPAAQEAA